MTQGKVSVTNKSNDGSDVQPMASGPPSYEEATEGGSPCYSGAYPGDSEMLTEFSWDDQNIRRIFIRKVYTILMLQLSVTLAFVAVFIFCEPVKYYIQTNPGWYWASYVFVTYLTLSCCRGPRRQFPWNLILLIIFTLSLSYMTGMLSSYYNTKSVVICLGITALVPWLHAVYAALGAILFCMFLAFDTQMLMGKKQYTISPEEYIFATLSICLDIVYIFTFLLQLFGTPERE